MKNITDNNLIHTLPDALVLSLQLKELSLLELSEVCEDALAVVGLPKFVTYTIPRNGPIQYIESNDEHHEELSELSLSGSIDGQFSLDGGHYIDFSNSDEEQNSWDCYLNIKIDKKKTVNFPDLLQVCAQFSRYMLEKQKVSSGYLRWIGGGAQCLPNTPLVYSRCNLVITSDEFVRKIYSDANSFWQAGWSHIETFGEIKLLLRAMNITNSVDYLRQIMSYQWQLARAAKANYSEYYLPQLLPEEETLYESGEAVLEAVGYAPENKLVEFSCYLDLDSHINGWEIYKLLRLVRKGELSSGKQVDTVRVVFFNQEMAEKEKRPLLDIDVKVFYMAETGEDIEVTE